MKLFIFILLLSIIIVVGQDLVYKRIPKYNMGYFILDYFERMELNNCFKKQISEYETHLKCLKNGELVDVLIKIESGIWI